MAFRGPCDLSISGPEGSHVLDSAMGHSPDCRGKSPRAQPEALGPYTCWKQHFFGHIPPLPLGSSCLQRPVEISPLLCKKC